MLSDAANTQLNRAFDLVNKVLQSDSSLQPDDIIKALAYKGFLLAHKFVVQKEDCWEEYEECFRKARFEPNALDHARSLVLYMHARALKMRGDMTVDRTEQLMYNAEGLELVKESESMATDLATQHAYQRLQAKSNPKMTVILDPCTGDAMVIPMENDVELEALPRGPQHAPTQRPKAVYYRPD